MGWFVCVGLCPGGGGGGGGGGGALGAIRVPIGAVAGVVDSTATIAAGAVIWRAELDVDAPYDPGVTVTVGTPAAPAAFLAATENAPTVADLYRKEQQTVQGAAEAVRVTVAGAVTMGSGSVIVYLATPLP